MSTKPTRFIAYRCDECGCHYLAAPFGSLTPRLRADGTHLCEGGRS